MDLHLYNFFENPQFDKCFFTGEDVTPEERIPVFPQWILDRYDLSGQWMGMLNWNRVKYGDLYIPCSVNAQELVLKLENEIQKAFENGYEEVKALEEDQVFLWMSKILLGILYHDIQYSIDLGRKRNKPYSLSPLLTRKFSELHFMLQSLVRPVRWTVKPYSLILKKVDYSQDVFNFRDETKNLNFSLGMNGFGLIACLHDMGENMEYHRELLKKIDDSTLHAIQFEELCAKFIYSNYLLKEHAGWNINIEHTEIVMTPKEEKQEAAFTTWDDKMFASVLPDYWKVWGLEPKDIYTFPDSPVSFLINENTNKFITREEIDLPS